jgi:hypothetical protein
MGVVQLPLSFIVGILSMNSWETSGYQRPVWPIIAIMIPLAGTSDQTASRRIWILLRDSVSPLLHWISMTAYGLSVVVGRWARQLAVCCAVVIGEPFIALWSLAYMGVKSLAMCLNSVGPEAVVRFWSTRSTTSSGTEEGTLMTINFVLFLLRNAHLVP